MVVVCAAMTAIQADLPPGSFSSPCFAARKARGVAGNRICQHYTTLSKRCQDARRFFDGNATFTQDSSSTSARAASGSTALSTSRRFENWRHK